MIGKFIGTVAVCLLAVAGFGQGGEQAIQYRGIRPTDPSGRTGLRNPERGFRMETLIAEKNGRTEGVWGTPAFLWNRVPPGYSDTQWAMDVQRQAADGVTLIQAYCYLTEFHDRPISPEKLRLLEQSFARMRALGIKCVLRFAYIKDYPAKPTPPKIARILQHLGQLKPVLARNVDVIHTLEAGFVAAWGEWHEGNHITDERERATLLKKLLAIVPPTVFIQVRYPGIKTQLLPQVTGVPYRPLTGQNAFSSLPEARLGHNDDGVMTHPKDMAQNVYAREPTRYGDLTALVKQETNFVPMGGEFFWSDQGWYGDGVYTKTFDGLETAINLRDYHFNVFSLAHSYSEREGKPMTLNRWKTQVVTPEQLSEAHLPVSRDWFTDADGKPVTRTIFDYVRDHLGYRLELQRLRYTATIAPGQPLSLTLTLINRGFSTLFHKRPVVFVLLDTDGNVTELPPAAVDVRRWFPHTPGDNQYKPLEHTISYRGQLPSTTKPGTYTLGLWMPDANARLRARADYALRVANGDVPFWTTPDGRKGGINLIGTVTVTGGK